MKVILWMAMSVNGIIARENNEEDFLSHENWIAWLEAIRRTGVVVWGRKTHEVVKTWEKEYFEDLNGIRAFVLSSDPDYKVENGFELARSPEDVINILEKEGVKELIVTGGSTVNSAFGKLGLLDEVIVNIEPTVIGKGIPLFKPEDFDLKLELIEMEQSKGKTIQLRYRVVK